jgi:anti-sigma factor RsiW
MSAEDAHGRIQDDFSAYVDGELPAGRRATIDEHLATCIQCRTSLERFRRTVGGLSALKKKAPETFLPKIQQQIFTRSQGRFFNRRRLLFGRVPFEWVSLAMIVAMLVYYVITLQSAPTGVSPAP